jgi:V-type ATPase 116kDa subunit family
MVRDIYSARYMLFMMGSMGVYAGLVYNDYFSLGLNLFGSNYEFLSEESGSKVRTVSVFSHNDDTFLYHMILYFPIVILRSLNCFLTLSPLPPAPPFPTSRFPLVSVRPYCFARTVTPSACTPSEPIPSGKYQQMSSSSSTR